MSSIVERLTEGVVNRDMRAESHALLSKWKKTGLLEGLEGERQTNSMARLLENQAKELLREQSTLAAGSVEGFAAVAFPIVRRVFAGLIANDLVSVQPMSLPSGLIFFLDFTFSSDLGTGTTTGRLGNTAGDSIYGTDKKGAGVIDGVSLIGSSKEDLSGPRTAATRGYAYASPTGSNGSAITNGSAGSMVKAAFVLDGSVTDPNKKLIEYDADLLSVTDSSLGVVIIDIEEEELTSKVTEGDPDFDNLSPFLLDATAAQNFADGLGSAPTQIRRLTRLASASEAATTKKAVRFTFVAATVVAADLGRTTAIPLHKVTIPVKDTIDAVSDVAGAVVGDLFELEANAEIPEINIQVDSTAVTAQTKKLKAKWTPELGQDLNAYHNLDAEVELTSILSEQIALEIDREILADLVNGATAATRYWSRAPGLFVDSNGNELGASTAAPDFTGTVSEWYETLVETINDVSAQIHRKTLRGGANFVVCGPEVANVLEFTAGFRASVTHDDEKGSIGALRVGSLSKKFDVIVDPYFLRNVILVGRRGASFLESGYVYAPYVPLQTTPTIFGPMSTHLTCHYRLLPQSSDLKTSYHVRAL